jgi:alkylation response protein AidB-like acyl-CoA dehydrogenase
MNLLVTEEQQLAMDELRRFLDNEVEPGIRDYLAADRMIPVDKMKSIQQSLIEYGLVAGPQPEELGGLGLDWTTHLLLFEEVVRCSLDIAAPIIINTVGADLLTRVASNELKERYLPGLLSGETMVCFAISEPDVGSDVAAIKSRARQREGSYVLNGEKTWITNGQYSDFAVCTMRTGDLPGELTHFLVDREEHGYEVADIKKIALNSQSTAQVFLKDVEVPATNIVGGLNEALKNTLVAFERARLHMAVWGYGLARRALEESVKYSQDRTQHGKPIAGHQLIAAKIATMATEIDAARLLTLRAAAMIDRDMRCDKECAMAKWYGTELGARATRDAVQIHGGNGVTREFIVERLAREGIIGPIPDGTTEIQKLIVARGITGISAF